MLFGFDVSKEKNFVLGFVVCFKIDFNLGLVFLKKIFLFRVLGLVSRWVFVVLYFQIWGHV